MADGEQRGQKGRTRAGVLLAGVVLLLAVAVVLWSWDGTAAPGAPAPTAPAPDDGRLEIHFLDVGQGDATFLRAPGASILVDVGRHDAGDVVAHLDRLGVGALDVVAVTHPHADHIGQLPEVLTAVPVGEVWWSGSTHTTRTFEHALEALEASDAAYEEPRAGDVTMLGDLEVAVANPETDDDPDDLHAHGLVLRVRYGGRALLLTGDAEAPTEAGLVARRPDLLDADVLQLGHHGSATSTSDALLAAVSPQVAVYSAGAGNPYGHPHGEVLARLQAAGVEVYGTDVHGTVVVTTDGRDLVVTTERAG